MRDFFGNIMRTDILGRRISKKQIKREVLAENRQRGKAAEESYKMSAALRGAEVERKHRGQDYVERQRNPWTGRVTKTTHVEVKSSSTAPLSKLQQRTKRNKPNYKVVRQQGFF